MKLDYVSSKGKDEEHYSKSDNIEIMINDEADKVIKKTLLNQSKTDIKII